MAGHNLNKKELYKKTLQDWIDKVIQGKLWENYVDLHIDEVDKEFKKKEKWLNASLLLFNYILELIDVNDYNAILVIPLSFSETPTDLNDLNLMYVENRLDLTPPSFYLFPLRYNSFEKTINSSSYIKKISDEINRKVYFKEEKDGDEYFRVLYIERG